MKRKKRILAQDAIGSVTQEIWEPETPDETSEALRMTLRAKPNGWGIQDEIDQIRKLLDEALSNLGWPDSKQTVAVDESGNWRPIGTRSELKEGEKYWWSFLWIRTAAPPLSEAFHLGQIAFSLECLQNALTKGDQLNFFFHSMRLGVFQSEIDIRKIALRYAEVGKKQISAGKQGNEMRSKQSFAAAHGLEAQAKADEIAAQNPSLSWTAIRNILAKKFGVSPETIKKSLKNPKKLG